MSEREVPRRARTIDVDGADARGADAATHAEVEFHIGMRAEALMREGLDGRAAHAQAAAEFGEERASLIAAEVGVRKVRRRRRLLGDVTSDVRYAVRGLLRNRTFAVVALATLALGTGATVAIFSIVNAYLIRPLPLPAAERVVMVSDYQPNYGNAPASYPEFEEWRARSASFDLMAGLFRRTRTYAGGTYPEQVRVAYVTEDFLPITGARPVAGRLLLSHEHAMGAEPVIVLAESFWNSRFASDRGVVGGTIRLGPDEFTVVGVAADLPEFTTGLPTAGWMPLEPNPLSRARGMHFMAVWGRLREGVSQEQAVLDLESVALRSNEESGNDHSVRLMPLRDLLVGEARPLLVAMLGIVAFVLVIAALNVANLLLVRAASREQEFAVRAALGAGRVRLVRQLFVEGFVLAAAGGVLGLGVGWAGSRLLLQALPATMSRPDGAAVDATVVLAALGIVMGATLMFGLAPAVMQRSSRLGDVLRSARAAASRGRLLRQSIIVIELALSMALLVGAALMTHSFIRLSRVDVGFTPTGLLSSTISLPASKYDTPERVQQFTAELGQSLAAIPGVRSVAFASGLPTASFTNGDVAVEGEMLTAADRLPPAEKRWVSPSYLETLGIELKEGRFFDDGDRAGAPRVVVINATMARRLWPDASALGHRINSAAADGEWEEIVGVVGDVRSWGVDQLPPLEVLHPMLQDPAGSFQVALRFDGAPDGVISAMRNEVRALDAELPVQTISLVDEVIASSVAGRRLLLLLALSFGTLAVLLAAIGTAGLVAYGIARRTREIGLRLALGARPGQLISLFLSEGLTLAVLGIMSGIVIALFSGQVLRTQLYDVAATDAAAYVSAIIVLTSATLLASYLPARRLLRLDPVTAMRVE